MSTVNIEGRNVVSNDAPDMDQDNTEIIEVCIVWSGMELDW